MSMDVHGLTQDWIADGRIRRVVQVVVVVDRQIGMVVRVETRSVAMVAFKVGGCEVFNHMHH